MKEGLVSEEMLFMTRAAGHILADLKIKKEIIR
jgi:hypothetical protein